MLVPQALRRRIAAEHKRRRKDQHAVTNAAGAQAAYQLVFVTKRPLSVEECTATLRDPGLTQPVLRCYVDAVQKQLGKASISKKGSPGELCVRLAGLMRENKIGSPFVAL